MMEILLLGAVVIVIAAVVTLIVVRQRQRRRLLERAGGGLQLGEADLPRERSQLVAYALWLFLGLIGVHRYYLRSYLVGFLFTITLGFVGIGWLIDVFLIPGATRKSNRRLWEHWFAHQPERWKDVAGTARDVSLKTMQAGDYPGAVVSKQILGFRVEVLDDEGNVVERVAVELIGNLISGVIRDGDSVEVNGKLSTGHILRALYAENKTTDSRVTVQF